MVRLLTYLILFIAVVSQSLSIEITHKKRWRYFSENFYFEDGINRNFPVIDFYYAYSNVSDPMIPNINEFHPTHTIEGSYGFMRIDDTWLGDDIFRHRSEFVFLGNKSSDFKTFDIPEGKIYTDTWRFGFGLKDGFGFIVNNGDRLFLNHTASITFSNIDFDDLPPSNNVRERINDYDNKLKFGINYVSSIDYQLGDIFAITLAYDHSLVFDDYQFGNWLGMWVFDNITQRWIDYYELDFLEEFGRNYPVMKFIYKNALSFIVYRLRVQESYFPFESDPAMSFDTFRIGIKLLFE